MGVPVNKLICASNANNVLTDFLKTGIYDRNRDFHATISPSMDILISSNLERLLYMLSGENDKLINEWFGKLAAEGRYEVSDDVKKILFEEFSAGCCNDAETKATIKEIYDKYSYTCDTHTAVAVRVYEDYKAATGDKTKTIIASTASPYKFSGSVLSAIGEDTSASEFDLVDKLAEVSKLPVPASLAALKDKEIRFSKVIDKTEMKEYVFSTLGI
jgi:threonine synthase